MLGIFEGDTEQGELEMGQSSGLVKDIISADDVVKRLIAEYQTAKKRINEL
jgi:enoyl-[acyl-carrier protein] reductase II